MPQAEIGVALKLVDEMQPEIERARGMMAGLGETIAGALRGASVAFTAGAAAAGTYAFHSAMVALRADEMNVALTALARANNVNVDSLNRYVDAIRKQGIEMGVAQNLVAEFVSGNLDLAKAQDLARVAQDAAVISGHNSTETLAMLVDGIRTQQIEVLRSAGVTVSAAGAYEEYAKAHGVAASSLSETTKQQILLDAVLREGASVQGAYAAAMETPSKQLRSIPRLLDDISINIGRAFLPAVGSVIHDAYELAKSFAQATESGTPLNSLLGMIGGTVSRVEAPLNALTTEVQSFLKGLDAPQMRSFLEQAQRMAPLLASVAAAFTAVGLGMARDMLPVVGGLVPAINPLLAIFGALVATSPPLQAAIAQVGTIFVDFATGQAPLVRDILQVLSNVLSDLSIAIAPLLPVLASLATQFVSEVLPSAVSLASMLGELAIVLVASLAPGFLQILNAVMPLVPSLVDLLNAVVPLAVQVIGIAMALVEMASSAGALMPIILGLAAAWLAWNVQLGIHNGLLAIQAALMGGPGLAAFLIRVIAVTVAMGPLTAITALWNVLLMANPIGLIIVGIAALVAGIVLLITHWSQVSAVVMQVWAQVEAFAVWFGGFFVAVWNAVSGAIAAFFTNLLAMAAAGWAEFARHPFYWIGFIVAYIPVKLFELYGQFIAWVGQMEAMAAGWAGGMIVQAFTAGIGFFNQLVGWLRGLPGAVWGALGAVLGAAGSFAASLPGYGSSAASQFGSALLGELQNLPGQMWSIGVSIAQGIINGIRAMIGAGIGAIGDFVRGIISGGRAAAGSGSPSKVAEEQIGITLGQGVIVGIQRMAGEASAAMASLVSGGIGIGGAEAALAGRTLSPAGAGAAGARIPIEIPLYLDGREIARAIGQPLLDEIILRSGYRGRT